nr:hypothetical protein CFP56_51209 [Quercus suber]
MAKSDYDPIVLTVSLNPAALCMLYSYRFIETKEVRRENPKKKKPEKGRYQHKEPPSYSKQITNLSTKPKQVAKSTLETLTMLRSECYLDQSLQLQRTEAFKIDLLNFV